MILIRKWTYIEYCIYRVIYALNFCRIHKILRVTPALEAGLTNDIIVIEDIVKLTMK